MKKIAIFLVLVLPGKNPVSQEKFDLYSSSQEIYWEHNSIDLKNEITTLNEKIIIDTAIKYQSVDGWGGCFNEKGWQALTHLNEAEREEVMAAFFDDSGCAFTYCRMPIGASDYALDYYSLNDSAGDFEMKYFSIGRDKKYLIPFIKAAMKYQPQLKVWGSPWTPPAWMKTNQKYFQGELKQDQQNLKAYALYFLKYVKAYKNEGINIFAIHVQNEPLHLPTFPSCGWTGQQMADFIGNYLGPAFHEEKLNAEIWLGTLNGNPEHDEYKEFIVPALSNLNVSKYITGCGFQWYGDAAVDPTIANFLEKKIIQTETKCGNGYNSWKYAFETYDQMHWYLCRNATAYLQWNMVLDQSGKSSWGWKQNAMITVDTVNREAIFNPQFYIVKHFSHFLKPGAKRIHCTSSDYLKPVAFQNPDGSVIFILANREKYTKTLTIDINKKSVDIELKIGSVNTLLIN
jgi:glucosylceramidase